MTHAARHKVLFTVAEYEVLFIANALLKNQTQIHAVTFQLKKKRKIVFIVFSIDLVNQVIDMLYCSPKMFVKCMFKCKLDVLKIESEVKTGPE